MAENNHRTRWQNDKARCHGPVLKGRALLLQTFGKLAKIPMMPLEPSGPHRSHEERIVSVGLPWVDARGVADAGMDRERFGLFKSRFAGFNMPVSERRRARRSPSSVAMPPAESLTARLKGLKRIPQLLPDRSVRECDNAAHADSISPDSSKWVFRKRRGQFVPRKSQIADTQIIMRIATGLSRIANKAVVAGFESCRGFRFAKLQLRHLQPPQHVRVAYTARASRVHACDPRNPTSAPPIQPAWTMQTNSSRECARRRSR